MEFSEIIIISALFFVAILYSSVGHGGASGYLAVMALAAISPGLTRPTALVLNVFVASIAAVQFFRRGHFSWRIFLSFAAASIPAAYLGGSVELPIGVYKITLGVVLIFAAFRLAIKLKADENVVPPRLVYCLGIGAFIGLLSGLVGVGGGIFLTPILLIMHWAEARTAAGVSAAFILVNSIAGLAGQYSNVIQLPVSVSFWILAAVLGGIIGSSLGSKRFDSLTLRRVLAVVLLIAGVKLILV